MWTIDLACLYCITVIVIILILASNIHISVKARTDQFLSNFYNRRILNAPGAIELRVLIVPTFSQQSLSFCITLRWFVGVVTYNLSVKSCHDCFRVSVFRAFYTPVVLVDKGAFTNEEFKVIFHECLIRFCEVECCNIVKTRWKWAVSPHSYTISPRNMVLLALIVVIAMKANWA